jgi:hypothetical protein
MLCEGLPPNYRLYGRFPVLYRTIGAARSLHQRFATLFLLTIPLTNPGEKPQEVALTLKNLVCVKQLTKVRTSATEDSKVVGAVTVEGGNVRLTLPGQNIVTLTTMA